jgi:hypothetical protein
VDTAPAIHPTPAFGHIFSGGMICIMAARALWRDQKVPPLTAVLKWEILKC